MACQQGQIERFKKCGAKKCWKIGSFDRFISSQAFKHLKKLSIGTASDNNIVEFFHNEVEQLRVWMFKDKKEYHDDGYEGAWCDREWGYDAWFRGIIEFKEAKDIVSAFRFFITLNLWKIIEIDGPACEGEEEDSEVFYPLDFRVYHDYLDFKKMSYFRQKWRELRVNDSSLKV